MTLASTDLLDTARRLLPAPGERAETCLRRATSTIYYAMFHALSASVADLLVGPVPGERDEDAWLQAYRALDHRVARNACRDGRALSRFPLVIQGFADHFVAMQDKRHDADYDPSARFVGPDVIHDLALAEQAIAGFLAAPEPARRAFCAGVLFRKRP